MHAHLQGLSTTASTDSSPWRCGGSMNHLMCHSPNLASGCYPSEGPALTTLTPTSCMWACHHEQNSAELKTIIIDDNGKFKCVCLSYARARSHYGQPSPDAANKLGRLRIPALAHNDTLAQNDPPAMSSIVCVLKCLK